MFPGDQDSLPSTTDPTAPTVPPIDVSASASDDSLPRIPLTRYRPLRFHAKGGLGEVHLARDEECHREVALKTIQAERAGNEAWRERFLREAEITARLEHPNVVPVYGMGVGADGRPCYAMQFISGETLHEAVQRFHADQAERGAALRARPLGRLRALFTEIGQVKRDRTERALARRQLLAHLIAVCNAVAYAHSRGIIHRDLKPQNVMLGKYGETLVVDWGLARVFRRPPAERRTSEDSLIPTGEKGQELTHSGQVVGTPAYMSPEPAAGHLVALGPASDIYSLGATLYFLLTGQPPIREANVALLLAKVQAGEFPPPRKVKRTVSRGLEAICRKAMALRPEDRYAKAEDLAGDISRWLADERVMAWREPMAERVERLSRKHSRYLAGLTVAFVLLSPLVGFTVEHFIREYDESLLREENNRLHEKVIRQTEMTISALEAQLEAQSEANALKHRIMMMEEKQALLDKTLQEQIRQNKAIPPNKPLPPPANERD